MNFRAKIVQAIEPNFMIKNYLGFLIPTQGLHNCSDILT